MSIESELYPYVRKTKLNGIIPLVVILNSNTVKPILRPMSDLSTTIHHDNTSFTPIVELFNTKYASGAYDVIEIESTDNSCSLNIAWDKVRSSTARFSYVNSDNSFVFHDGSKHSRVGYQLEMFNKLFSWHFDVFGLIPAGLAIDINTLPAC